ncbi:MAG: putative DNA binding domain-containing protein [Dysgonamonadaceae bacterium]|jgi:ATP-dependent DNA helicase RecG|nr:putative DNA binding domain-containing protein [Dysgonamonadaceae bacterium]
MSEQELNKILSDAVSLPAETEIVEFKEAKESYDFGKIGKYFSALSNEANLKGKICAWLIFGVENTKHRIVGSNYRPNRKDLDSLKKEIGDKTTQNISFIEIYELHKPEGRVIMFQIPAAPQGIPIAYEGFYYGRANESLVALNIEKIERIRNQVIGKDWSKNIVPEATFDDLDKDAIQKAREQYKQKNVSLKNEVDIWDDVTFLNKAKVTLNGQITNTAILLLGKDEAGALLSPAIAQITWVLKDAPGGYEHFFTPFILTIDKTLDCIRNLRYSFMVNDNSLFPKEVTRYDKWVIRELLQNCVAHQDYGKSCRIIVLEYNDKLIFQNAGGFIPDSVEEVIRHNSPQDYYRNPFLAAAMVNLNMIETVGNGIKKIFTIQKERLFPLPTYDISDDTHTKVTIYGKLLDENYTNILNDNPELPLEDVIALDKVQKKQAITEKELNRLRSLKLVKGRAASLQLVGDENYIRLSNSDLKQKIVDLIKEKGSASREDIDKLIIPLLPADLPIEKRQKKISNLILDLSNREGIIKNSVSSDKFAVWVIINAR